MTTHLFVQGLIKK